MIATLFGWMFNTKKDKLIRTLKIKNVELVDENIKLGLAETDLNACNSEKHSLNNTISSLQTKICELNKYADLKTYREWFKKNIVKRPKYYAFRGVSRPAHVHLENFSKNSRLLDMYESFLRDKFFFDKKYDSPDQLVYDLVVYLHSYVRRFSGGEYKKDIELFKKTEHWMSPEEAYLYYVKKLEAGDCDDKATFIYCCIVTALIYFGFWTEHSWRLKHFIVDLITREGHYLLGWMKEHENKAIGFVPVESTFRHDKFKEVWKHNMTFKNNILYQTRFSFDEKTEYVNIGKRT